MAIFGYLWYFSLNYLPKARNAARFMAISSIIDAIYIYEYQGNDISDLIGREESEICDSRQGECGLGGLDISAVYGFNVNAPRDPFTNNANVGKTGFYIKKENNGRLMVTAPLAEKNAVIQIIK
ncbi:MAG: hypothetical protein CEN89_455 [Candidatus Berkelbacteria bacterium Licking1014_7]|uniref:Uncharacterized protein n=1 Tax=Candidatus Berkelbacteria bacterium Licking1014_7 TaxID=2017147 RepID=A0A554LIP8_9BACT|nr:MAG: hypothetical protein CEN89_455 [Candidatus Berkelbacteria bacterium Licking1014_7]